MPKPSMCVTLQRVSLIFAATTCCYVSVDSRVLGMGPLDSKTLPALAAAGHHDAVCVVWRNILSTAPLAVHGTEADM